MLRRLRDLLRDGPIMEIAVGIALAFAIVDLADSIAYTFVAFWRYEAPPRDVDVGTALALENLFNRGFRIGDRYLDVAEIVGSLIQLVLVVGVALLLRPREPAATSALAEDRP